MSATWVGLQVTLVTAKPAWMLASLGAVRQAEQLHVTGCTCPWILGKGQASLRHYFVLTFLSMSTAFNGQQ